MHPAGEKRKTLRDSTRTVTQQHTEIEQIPKRKIKVNLAAKRSEQRRKSGVGIWDSPGGGKQKGTKVKEWGARYEGRRRRHLMGFDARQSYERVTAKEILHTHRIFALIAYKLTTYITIVQKIRLSDTTCFSLSYSSKLH